MMYQQGGIYLVVLFIVASTGAGLGVLGRSWAHDRQREKETELLHAGATYRQAIGRYFEATPGPTKRYPPDIGSLLLDPRFPGTQRHLRQPIPDPMTGKVDWILIPAPGGGYSGVASRSESQPIKRKGFAGHNVAFELVAEQKGDRLRYRDWEFIHSPGNRID